MILGIYAPVNSETPTWFVLETETVATNVNNLSVLCDWEITKPCDIMNKYMVGHRVHYR